jgi:hypothetical protein
MNKKKRLLEENISSEQSSIELPDIQTRKKIDSDTIDTNLQNFSAPASTNLLTVAPDTTTNTLPESHSDEQPTFEQKSPEEKAAINTLNNVNAAFDWGINYTDRINQADDTQSNIEERHPCDCDCCDDLPFQISGTWRSILNCCCG